MTYDEVARAINRFYNDPLNDRISISACLVIIAGQFKGYAPELLDIIIRHFRQEVAKDQK